jgi:TRAP-type transport system periplasmic protein
MRATFRWALAAVLVVSVAACANSGNEPAPTDNGSSAEYDEVTLRLASMVPQQNSFMQTVDWWVDEVNSRSGGAISVEMFYAESLLAGPEIMPGVRDGVVDLGLMAGAYHRDEFPLFNGGTLPFLTVNPVAAAFANAELYQDKAAARDEFERQGLVPLMWLPASPTVLGTTFPVSNMDDISGQRIRSVGWLSEALEGAGATPVNLAAGEMYESIQRGVLEGAAAVTFDVYPAFGLHEVAPYITDTGLGVFNSVTIIANQQALEALSPATRDLLITVAEEAYEEQAQRFLDEAEDAACEQIRDEDGVVTIMAADEQQRWRDLVAPTIRDRWLDEVTGLGVERDVAVDYLDTLNQLLVDFDGTYDNGLQRCAG